MPRDVGTKHQWVVTTASLLHLHGHARTWLRCRGRLGLACAKGARTSVPPDASSLSRTDVPRFTMTATSWLAVSRLRFGDAIWYRAATATVPDQ